MPRRVLHLIPADPAFSPEDDVCQAAAELLQHLVGDCEEVRAAPTKEVRCPLCATDVSLWWRRLVRKSEIDGLPVEILTPCCSSLTPVTSFKLRWPDITASFVLEARNPTHLRFLSDDEQARLEDVLGCALRQVVSPS